MPGKFKGKGSDTLRVQGKYASPAGQPGLGEGGNSKHIEAGRDTALKNSRMPSSLV